MGNQNDKYPVPKVNNPLKFCDVKDDSDVKRFKNESIAGDMIFESSYTAHLKNGCGPQAISWCLQAAKRLNKIDHWSCTFTSGPNIARGMFKMLDYTELGYEGCAGFSCQEVDRHLSSGQPVLALITSKYEGGQYHWIVLIGIDSANPNCYWVVSNGWSKETVRCDVIQRLVNKAIGNLFMGGFYLDYRVILVKWNKDRSKTK